MKNIRKAQNVRGFCFATVVIAMVIIATMIGIYMYTGEVTTPIAHAILTVGVITVIACIRMWVAEAYLRRNTKKEYKTPIERLNTAFITLCCVTVLVIEALIGEYMIFGHEYYIIINPVMVLGIINVALIPLGAIFQLWFCIAEKIEEKKRLAQRG